MNHDTGHRSYVRVGGRTAQANALNIYPPALTLVGAL